MTQLNPSTTRTHTCPWCGHVSDASTRNCPACGAAIDVRTAITASGWAELPAIADMARLQFGSSVCQIEGKTVPVADFNLAAGDGIYFAHHLLLWKDDAIQIAAMKLAGAWKRMFAGMPLVMTQATGPGRIAFSKDRAGELVALPMQANTVLDVREHVFMVATHSVAYDWFQTGIWYSTQEDKSTETHYPIGMFMDRFQTQSAPGLLILHGAGNVFERRLAPGETIFIKPTSLLFKDPAVTMNLHWEKPGGTWRSFRSWGDRYLWLRVVGPGRVGVQSHYEQLEDKGQMIAQNGPGTTASHW